MNIVSIKLPAGSTATLSKGAFLTLSDGTKVQLSAPALIVLVNATDVVQFQKPYTASET